MGIHCMESRWNPDDSWKNNRNYFGNFNFSGQRQQGPIGGNRQEDLNVTSFYITKFPYSVFLSDLWHVYDRIRKF